MWNFNTMRYYLEIFSVLLVLSLYHFRGKKLNQYGKPEVLVTAGGFFVGNFSLKKKKHQKMTYFERFGANLEVFPK